jgi:hypothetical protein
VRHFKESGRQQGFGMGMPEPCSKAVSMIAKYLAIVYDRVRIVPDPVDAFVCATLHSTDGE